MITGMATTHIYMTLCTYFNLAVILQGRCLGHTHFTEQGTDSERYINLCQIRSGPQTTLGPVVC